MPIQSNLVDDGAVGFDLATSGQFSIFVFGEFGSGDVALTISPDGGETEIPMLDAAGDPVVFSADGHYTFNMTGEQDSPPKLIATMDGSTDPDVNIRLIEPSRQPWRA